MNESPLLYPDLASIERKHGLGPRSSSTMAKRRLFLHIGLPKTGTSFIQAVLNEQRAALQKQGILYPATGLDGFGHKLLALPFLSDDRKRLEDARAALDRNLVTLWSELQDEILRSAASKIILSSEYFSEAVTVRFLRSICDRNDIDASVIVYLRRQDQVLESGYNQAVKVGIQTAKVVLGENYIEALDYDALLGRWADVFGDKALLVRTFEDAVAGPGILEDFMSLVGAELDIPNASVERNEGLHPGLIDFRRVENVVGLIDSRLTKLANPLLRKLDPRPGLSLMSAENRERFLSYYAESNARVARRYLGKQDGVLFAGPEGEAAEDLLEADACLSVILSCAYNDMLA